MNTIEVYANSEDGLQTITLDPAFEDNGWVYLYYAPRTMTAPYPATTPTGSAPNTLPAGADESYWNQWKGYNQLSRFTWNADTNSLDLASEQVIIKVEVQRGQCCHVAGDVAFDNDGNLLLSTGDNTPPARPVPTATRRTTTGSATTPVSTRVAAPATRTTCAARS